MRKNILKDKSYKFSIEIINLYKKTLIPQKEYVLSKQILRSGTSVWANIYEAEFGQSRADFVHKISIALKEANESLYRLDLLSETWYIENSVYRNLCKLCYELIKILVCTIKTSKRNSSS